MNFDITEEQERNKLAARELAARELAPRAATTDREARLPDDLARRLGEAGLLGQTIPAEHGGAGGDLVSFALVVEEIAAACASSAALVGAHALVCRALLRHGTDEQKKRLLGDLARGASIGTAALPDREAPPTPSSLAAKPDASGGFVLDGESGPITLGQAADRLIVFAATEGSGLVALLVPKDAAGLEVVAASPCVGRRAAGMATLRASGVRVPSKDVLGAPAEGLAIANEALEEARIAVAAEAVGVARAAFERAAEHVKREQIAAKSAGLLRMQAELADMAVSLDAARLLVLRAARLADGGTSASTEASIAKLFAAETSTRVTRQAMQLLRARSGDGDTNEALARGYRDAIMTDIIEETSDLQREIIAQTLLQA